jgi:hypothetical protein
MIAISQHETLWAIYLIGAILTLTWKWLRYCLTGVYRLKKGFWKSSREWFEIVTLDSQVSWITTIAAVWFLGSVVIDRVGLNWFIGGGFVGIPNTKSFAFLIGSMSEMLAPALVKWITAKFKVGTPEEKDHD